MRKTSPMIALFALAAVAGAAQTVSGSDVREPAYPGKFALRTNLLYDALLTPTLGVEWRVSDAWGLKLDGSYADWGGSFGRIHSVRLLSPEVRRYMGQQKRFYLGLGFNAGDCDIYGLGPVADALFPEGTGYRGELYSGGLVAGYQMKLSRSLSLDLNLGVGYTHLKYDAFTVLRCETCAYRGIRAQNVTKNWFGPTQAGISLVWHFGKPKGGRASAPAYTPQAPATLPALVVRDTVVKVIHDTVVKEVVREVPQRSGEAMIRIQTLFATGSYALSGEAETELGRAAAWLIANPSVPVVIEGHTDNTGGEVLNRRLSENRAGAVYGFLVSQGVPRERLSYKGYGPDRPVADNSTAEGRQRNRRAVLKTAER